MAGDAAVLESPGARSASPVERRLRFLNRVYSVLSAIAELIVREKDPKALLDGACRIAVEKGQLRMAWVGMRDDARRRVVPVASAGAVDGYLDVVNVDLADPARSHGPTGRCVLTGEHTLCFDMATDPLFLPWREEALRRGYRSSASVPLRVGGEVVGAFTLYAGEPAFFTGEELALLDDVARDIGFALDVHRSEVEKHRVEQALRQRDRQFASAFEDAANGMALVAPDGRFLKANRALGEILGYAEAELTRLRFQDVTHPDDLAADLENVKRLLAGEIPAYRTEKRYVRKDGQTVFALLNASLVRDDEGRPLHLIAQIQDVTERRRLEEQLRQAQKMEAVGRLAGGVAHDFNNLLTTILGYAELIRAKVGDVEGLDEVTKAAGRAAALTRQLLTFSRREVVAPRVFDLNEVVGGLQGMLGRLIGEDVHLVTEPAAEALWVLADPGRMEQVVMNLALNARDAMPNGGTLRLATSRVDGPAPLVRLVVSDSGVGMDEATRAHVFEPFFTTKEPGKGTGLGLSMVYGIVKQAGGGIQVRSAPGEGAVFTIDLPRAEPPGAAAPAPRAPARAPSGAGSILLVEDEANVRRLAAALLRDAGYDVLEAESGERALEAARTYGRPIDLLLTDVVMTGMGGRRLAEALGAERPGMKILYMSGYTDDTTLRHGVLEGSAHFLQKPFTPDALRAAVSEILRPAARASASPSGPTPSPARP